MSQRQLHNLGINNALTTDSRTEVNKISDAATAATAVETFTINPCASDVNLSIQKGIYCTLSRRRKFLKNKSYKLLFKMDQRSMKCLRHSDLSMLGA